MFFKTLDPDSESGSRILLNPDPKHGNFVDVQESTLSSHLKENHNEKRREGETHKYRRLTYYK